MRRVSLPGWLLASLREVEVGEDTVTRVMDHEGEVDTVPRRSPGIVEPSRGPGDRIGPYTLLSHLGTGGMGVVFSARDDRLDREVALKLLRPSSSPRRAAWAEGRDRLRREAQAMAQLSHPNVVEVYDVGTDLDDLYIAMERVDGRSLAAWMREAEHPWREVVAMFVQAGRGLAAAHAAGLVHRDFKPGNVLVDRQGRARVLDFGLALPTAERRSQISGVHDQVREGEVPSLTSTDLLSSPLTEVGVVMGTPAYMAPEQHMGHEIGPDADQYAFCGALFEGLYGRRPFAGRDVKSLLRAKVEGEVAAPPLGSAVPRALHRVLVRGLEAASQARWPSMDALLERLEAQIHPPRRWAWWSAVGAGAVTAAVAVGLRLEQGAAPVASACREAQARLQQTWSPAARQSVRAALVAGPAGYAEDTATRVEQSLDDYAARWDAQRSATCEASEVRADAEHPRRMACLDRRLRRMEAVIGVLSQADAELLPQAVSMVRGLPSIERCAEATADDGIELPDDPQVAAAVQRLQGRLEVVKALVDAGRYDDAHALVLTVLEQAQTLGHAPLLDRASAWKGDTLLFRGELAEAEEQLVQTLHRAEASGDDTLVVMIASRLVFLVGHRMGRPDEGLKWGRHGEARLARLHDDPLSVVELRTAVGSVLADAGKAEEAAAQLRQAVQLWSELRGPDDIQTAVARNNLGIALFNLGRYRDAIEQYEEVLRIREQTLGPQHPDVGVALNNLANARAELGEHEQVLPMRQRVLEIWRAGLGEDHFYVAAALNNLANSAAMLGRYDEAIASYQRALAMRERTLGADHPEAATTRLNLGEVMGRVGRYDEALTHLAEARATLERSLGRHTYTAICLAVTGRILADRGEPAAAVVTLEEALAMEQEVDGAEHPQTATMHEQLASALLDAGRIEDARTHAERALAIQSAGTVAPDDLAHTRFTLARALRAQQQDPGRAHALATQAVAFWEHGPPSSADALAEAREWLAQSPPPEPEPEPRRTP